VQFLEVAVILLGADAPLDVLLPRLVVMAFVGRHAASLGIALLTDCSQTVRIHLDVEAHVSGKHTGQAYSYVRCWT
jgi:Na+-transporting methylmalonyl-CoA/oxaloacetate decarboxylase beta subunit